MASAQSHARIAAGVTALALLVFVLWRPWAGMAAEPIRIGIVYSRTGTMAISESALIDVLDMAIEEVNASGGLLGRPLEAVVVDGASDWQHFAQAVEQLIVDRHVAVLFACWTSACRKTVAPVVERHDNLLFYALQYEGLESSANIVYTGSSPNQQIVPAVTWSVAHLGRRVLLVGSDCVFPRVANVIVKDQLHALQAELVGEYYLPLGSDRVGPILDAVQASAPDVVLNTLNGDSNVAFFHGLRARGLGTATMSLSIGEKEFAAIGVDAHGVDYAAWSYFQSLPTQANREFLARYRARFGSTRDVTDPVSSTYNGFRLWARAVAQAGSAEPRQVRAALAGLGLQAPEGLLSVDEHNQHLWKPVRIARLAGTGQFEIVWSSHRPIRPVPYPRYRPREEWEALLQELQRGWGGGWEAPRAQAGEPP